MRAGACRILKTLRAGFFHSKMKKRARCHVYHVTQKEIVYMYNYRMETNRNK